LAALSLGRCHAIPSRHFSIALAGALPRPHSVVLIPTSDPFDTFLPNRSGAKLSWRTEMNRQLSDAKHNAYPDFGRLNRGIGLRAVAAAVRYQGDSNNAERNAERRLERETSSAAAAVAQSRDTES
jgi:hypothetical protein